MPFAFSVTQSGRGDTPTRDVIVGDTFQDRRHPGHQEAALEGSRTAHQPLRSQCHQMTTSTTVHSRTAPFGTSLSQNATGSCSPSFGEPPRWPSRAAQSLATPRLGPEAFSEPSVVRPLVTVLCRYRCRLLLAEVRHQTWALLCRCRCRLLLAEVPKGTDRNVELKLRLGMWEEGQINQDSNTQARVAGKNGRCNRRWSNNVGNVLAP